MKNLKTLLVAPLLLLSLACSQQWREADDGLEADQVSAAINSMISGATTSSDSGSEAATFKKLYEDPTSAIYFAFSEPTQKNTPLGMPWNVLTVQDLSVFGSPGLSIYDLESVNIAFIDAPGQGLAALAVDYAKKGDANYTTKFFATSPGQQPQVVNDELVFVFGKNLIAKTRDFDENAELKSVIQFKLYFVEADGTESYLGRIATLVGYD